MIIIIIPVRNDMLAVMIKSSHHSDLADCAVCYLFLQEGDSVFALDGLLGSVAKVNEMSENKIL